MIVVDTSASMAIVLDEPTAERCAAVLENSADIAISAATVAEALIVAARRGRAAEMAEMIDGLGFEVIAVTRASAQRVADVYAKWGKGLHPAGLNFGDCFAYELALQRACPLLFVGEDFLKTDIEPALTAPAR